LGGTSNDQSASNTTDISTSINGTKLSAKLNASGYPWLDWMNNYALIAGETNQSFTALVNGT
jgi:hypothetical protein